jgi:hypothetical protein
MPASFVEERRKEALAVYEREPIPTWLRSGFWTTHLRGLRLDDLEARHHEPVASLEELPEVVREALPDAGELAGLVCFFDERVDLTVDGVSRPRPVTPWSD